MVTRADKRTLTEAPIEYYSDIDINFSKNPITGNLVKIINEEAVKSSIRNLVLTRMGERPYDSSIGSKVGSLLFDQGSSGNVPELIKKTISQTIAAHEPRAQLIDIQVFSSQFTYNIIIYFTTVNVTEPITLELIVKRVR